MATSARVRGNVNPVLTFKIGAATAVSYSDDIKRIALSSEDKDDSDITFYEASLGMAKDYTLALTSVLSFAPTSFYRYLWTNAGQSAVVTYGPLGNATPAADKPHYQLTVSLVRPDFEIEASLSPAGAEFEVELVGLSDVTMLVA